MKKTTIQKINSYPKCIRMSSQISSTNSFPMRGQGGLQMLLTAEQEAQQIVAAARNLKMSRLRQAKEEADAEVAKYRSHLESEYQKSISESSGSSDSTLKRLETETEAKIQNLKETSSKVSPDVVKMLLKQIATVRN